MANERNDPGRPLTHQERVAAEHEDLKGNVDRLHNFVNGAAFDGVSEEEQQLLKTQLGQMRAYLATLNHRVALHKREAEAAKQADAERLA